MADHSQASWCIGAMSGTALDGVDVALIKTDGLALFELGPSLTLDYSDTDRTLLRSAVDRAVALGARADDDMIGEAARVLTKRHIEAVKQLLTGFAEPVELMGFHGQTIFHNAEASITWQIGEPGYLAQEIGLPVVWDMRVADVDAGGHGAPVAPLYHAALAHWSKTGPLAVLNLGGVANLTWLGSDRIVAEERWDEIRAFDTGPGNGLLDDWVSYHGAGRFDRDGHIASSGTVHGTVLDMVLDNPWFDLAPPKSLDRHDFGLEPLRGLSLADGAATLTAFTAQSVALGLKHFPQKPNALAVTGGGRRNPALMAALARACDVVVEPVEYWNWRGDSLEAEAFAYLAKRSIEGLVLTVPGTTGAPRPMTGGVTVLP